MELNLIIEDATANPIKFTLDGAPVNKRARFDQQRYSQANHTTIDPDKTYQQKFEKTDSVRLQFYSNFPKNRARIIDCEDVQYGSDILATVAVDYRNKFFRADCQFASMNGMLFIFFTQGLQYEDEDFTVAGELTGWNGRLPNINAVPGDSIRYSMDGGDTFAGGTITEIRWNPALQAEGYLIDVPITLVNPVPGLVEINYDEKPANLFAVQFSFGALQPGKYFIRREHGINDYDVSFTSEPLDIQEVHEDTLALEYSHEGIYNRADLWNYVYLANWTNTIRIPAAFYKFTPAGEVDVDTNDNGIPRILRAVPYRQIELNFFNMPSWLADKIQMALAHDTKVINGYQWEVENFGQFETIDRLDLGTYVIVLRQKDDRAKKVDHFAVAVTAEFVPPEHIDIPFGGGSVFSEFVTNSPFTFHFLSLPGWIVPDKETFVNGDTVGFAIAGVGTIGRSIVLEAVCEVNGLTAEISFSQLGAPPPAEFLDVSSTSVSLGYAAGSNQLLDVSSSGDWTASNLSGHPFTVVKESGFLQVRISEPSINSGPSTRVGVVRLNLNADPLIFEDITVSQAAAPPPPAAILSVTPTWWAPPPHHTSKNFPVVTEPGCKWQVTSSEYWIHVDWSVRTGSGNLNVVLDYPDFYDLPRNGVVTLINILNPANQIVITIEQN